MRNDNKILLGGGVFFAAALISFLMSFVYALFSYIFGDTTAYSVSRHLIAIVTQLLFILVVFVMSRRTDTRPDYMELKNPGVKGAGMGLGTAVIGLFGFYLLGSLFGYRLDAMGYSVVSTPIDNALDWVFMIIRVVLFAPVCEEVLFRGGVLSGTNSLFAGKRLGSTLSVILCGAMFALLHMNPAQTVYQFGFGCLLAILTIYSKSIIPAIIAHAANNIIALILELPFAAGLGGALYSFFSSLPALFVIVAILAAAGAVWLIWFACKKLYKAKEAKSIASEEIVDKGAKRIGILLFIFGAAICIVVWVLELALNIIGSAA